MGIRSVEFFYNPIGTERPGDIGSEVVPDLPNVGHIFRRSNHVFHQHSEEWDVQYKRILLFSASGFSSNEIAERIGKSPSTIKNSFPKVIFPALGVHTQAAAALKAIEFGIFSLSQALRTYNWELREALKPDDVEKLLYLLHNPELSYQEIEAKYTLSHNRHIDTAKEKLYATNTVMVRLITLAALATDTYLDYSPELGEDVRVKQALAAIEHVSFPYPKEWE